MTRIHRGVGFIRGLTCKSKFCRILGSARRITQHSESDSTILLSGPLITIDLLSAVFSKIISSYGNPAIVLNRKYQDRDSYLRQEIA